jgi:hypothetical protein
MPLSFPKQLRAYPQNPKKGLFKPLIGFKDMFLRPQAQLHQTLFIAPRHASSIA